MSQRSEVTFECGHVRLFPHAAPKMGERCFCHQCGDMRKVTGAPAEFTVKCRNCILRRPFGRDQIKATGLVVSHRRRYPTHTVELRDGHKLVHLYEPSPSALMSAESLATGLPPF